MRSRAVARLLGVTAGVAVLVTLTISPAAAKQPSWSVVPADTVGNQNFLFRGVAAPAADDVWAVGYHWEFVGGALEFRTLAEHYQNGRFQVVPTPDRLFGNLAKDFLMSTTAVSSSDVWAVGYSLPTGLPDETLVEHWDGSAWSIVASPNPSANGDILDGVDAIATDDVWAVGARQDGFYQSPAAQHWDGSSWTPVAVPNPAGCTGHSYLTAVSATGHSNVWAVGWCGSGGAGGDQGFVVHWNGRTWAVQAAAGTIPAGSQLAGITADTKHSVWVVGMVDSSGAQPGALVMRWDGAAWTRFAVPAPQDQANLLAVLGGHATTGWAVGAGPSAQPPFAGPSSVRFGKGVGTAVPVPVDFGSLHAITRDPAGTLWAVGQSLETQWDLPLVVRGP